LESDPGWWLCRTPDLAESFRLAGQAAAGPGTRVILGHDHADHLPAAGGPVPRASDLVSLVLTRGGRSERADRGCRQPGQGLPRLPGHQVLELDRARRRIPRAGSHQRTGR